MSSLYGKDGIVFHRHQHLNKAEQFSMKNSIGINNNNQQFIKLPTIKLTINNENPQQQQIIKKFNKLMKRRLQILTNHFQTINLNNNIELNNCTNNNKFLQKHPMTSFPIEPISLPNNTNDNTNKQIYLKNNIKKSKKTKFELFIDFIHLSKWLTVIIGSIPCLTYTVFLRILRDVMLFLLDKIAIPTIRLFKRLFPSKMDLSGKETVDCKSSSLIQKVKDYIILTHLYFVHPVSKYFGKLFFTAFFNSMEVIYESKLMENVNSLNAFEYYWLMNSGSSNKNSEKITKHLTLREEQLIREKGPFVFGVGNQRSLADGIAQSYYKTPNFVTLMNIEMAFFPIFGWISYGFGSEILIRQSPKQSWAVIENMKDMVRRGVVQTMIYPEGARQTSDTYELLPYKTGLFVLAIETQASVVPVVHYGVDKVWPYNDWKLHSNKKAYLIIGEPIETKGMTINQRYELLEIYRQRVKDMIKRMEQRLMMEERNKK
ncbi:hypothetical protein ABK040_010418 [Willaertia magna]